MMKAVLDLDQREDLQRDLAEKYPEEDVLECSKCGFLSPDTLEIPTCPGCGVAFDPESQPSAEGASLMTAAKTTEAKAEVVDLGTRRPTRAVKKPESTGMRKAAKQEEDRQAASAREKQAEAKAKKRLEKLESSIEKARSSKVTSDWDIGKALSEIYRGDLWQVAGNRSFVEYAQERFDIGKDTAWAYLRISETFTRKESEGFNTTQLWLLARVQDDDDRKALIEKVRSGDLSTKRELAEAVKVKRAEAGLETQRKGYEGTVALSGRIKEGEVVTSGKFKKKKGILVFAFELGGTTFEVRATGDNEVEVRHVK